MRRNSIDNTRLYNRNFGLVCVVGFLLYASAYAVLLPLMRSGLAVEVCVPFLVGMQVVGPFHAWLADKFRRKHVLVYPFVGMLLVSVGYGYASTPHQYSALALVQGMCFGLATSAAITLGIDVVHTGHRTKANMAYAFISRLGMAVGSVAGLWLMPINTYHWLGPVLAGAIGVLAASGLYVPFRAPIGLPVASADRYVLPRAVLPAFNVGLLAIVSPEAAAGIQDGDKVDVDVCRGIIRNLTQGEVYGFIPFPEFIGKLVGLGGLGPYVKSRLVTEMRSEQTRERELYEEKCVVP